MNSDLIFFILFAFIIFLLIFETIIPIEEEKKFKVLYFEICGVWYRFISLTVPFAKIVIFEKFLIIIALLKLKIYYKDIIAVSILNWVFSKGVKIVFKNQKGKIEKIIIWSFNSDSLYEKIKSLIEKESSVYLE